MFYPRIEKEFIGDVISVADSEGSMGEGHENPAMCKVFISPVG